MSDQIVFENHRFGEVTVSEADLLHFPGLPGFPNARRFVVMEHDRDTFFAWLVSVDDPDLALAIADPWQFFPEYDPPVELRHLNALGVEGPKDLEIMTVATFSGESARLNLVAPLLINPRNRRGVQVIFDRSSLSTREEIRPATSDGKDAKPPASTRLQAVPVGSKAAEKG
jgi:flagellar assembly factor FliW